MKEIDAFEAEVAQALAAPRAEDSSIAALVDDLVAALSSEPGRSVSENDAQRITQIAFRVASDRPQWTLTPVAANNAFEKLLRTPRILAAYRDRVPVVEIERRYGIARSSLYALLSENGVAANRPHVGRSRQVSHAAVRLAADDGLSNGEIASLYGCSARTVQRILRKQPRRRLQAFIDRLDVVEPGEPLRGAWNRYLDALAEHGPDVAAIDEPEWPVNRDRRALAAAALAYRYQLHDLEAPAWLSQPHLVSATLTSPVPRFIDIALPLTPSVVAHYNVALDEDSFHSV